MTLVSSQLFASRATYWSRRSFSSARAFTPKPRIFSRSSSDIETTVSMLFIPARDKQLNNRGESLNSSMDDTDTGSMGTGVLFANGSSGWVWEGMIRAFRNFNALWIGALIESIDTPPISADYGCLISKLFIRTWNGPDFISIWALEQIFCYVVGICIEILKYYDDSGNLKSFKSN